MARIYLSDQWFQQLSSTSLYEADYERLLLANAPALFPEYYVIPFKPIIQSETGSARPDLALVDRDLRLWWVVEVEMGHHSLNGHVLPQVAVLATGRYALAEAELLHKVIAPLDASTAIDLVKGAQPGVVVIANERRARWEDELRKLDVTLMIVEVFRSDRNAHALRVNGTYPSTPEDFLSECQLDPLIPGLLVIQAPAQLQVQTGSHLWIEIDGNLTEWTRYDVQDKVWLKSLGTNPLSGQRGPFKLLRRENGQLHLDASRR